MLVYSSLKKGKRSSDQAIWCISCNVYQAISVSSASLQIYIKRCLSSAFAFCSGVRTDVFISSNSCNRTSLLIITFISSFSSCSVGGFFLENAHRITITMRIKQQTSVHQPKIFGHAGAHRSYILVVSVSVIIREEQVNRAWVFYFWVPFILVYVSEKVSCIYAKDHLVYSHG